MSTAGPTICGTGSNSAFGGGTAWTNPSNCTADDATVAKAILPGAGTSDYLEATNFGFSIPAGATIDGIEFLIQGREKTTSDDINDNEVKVIKGGVRGTENKAAAGEWPTTFTDRTYGGSADLWSESWTYSDINASDFGVAFAAYSVLGGEMQVDYISCTITYTTAATVTGESLFQHSVVMRRRPAAPASVTVEPRSPIYSVTSVGPLSPHTTADDATVGTVTWANTDRIKVGIDGNTAQITLEPGEQSHYLVASNFGAGVPRYAVIAGIVVEIAANEDEAADNIFDVVVSLMKAGVVVGDNKADVTEWSTSAAYRSYGGASDVWGVYWTPEDVNASDFGVAFSINTTSVIATNKMLVDHVRVTIYYATAEAPHGELFNPPTLPVRITPEVIAY